MEHKTIELQYPITYTTETGEIREVTRLRLKRMKVKHLKKLPKNLEEDGSIGMDILVPLLAGMTGLPEIAIDEIDIADIGVISEHLNSFLSFSQ